MTLSEAHSAAIGSPRSRMSSSWRRINDVSTPRLRWVGSTPTWVTPAAGTMPPGTVSWNVYAPAVPTIRPSWNAARLRSASNTERSSSRSSGDIWPNASSITPANGSNSSPLMGRISGSMDSSPGLAGPLWPAGTGASLHRPGPPSGLTDVIGADSRPLCPPPPRRPTVSGMGELDERPGRLESDDPPSSLTGRSLSLSRRTLLEEVGVVLSLSLLASAVYAIIDLLSAPVSGVITLVYPQVGLATQLANIGFGLAPGWLVFYLVRRNREGLRAFGLDWA